MSGDTIADLLLARVGDTRPGLKSHAGTWSWDEVVAASAARASLARAHRGDGPFHIGVLLDNVPEYVFWLGAAALSGATIVGINPTRGSAELAQEVAHTDCQLVITDHNGLDLLDGLDIGVPRDRFLLVDDPDYPEQVAARATAPSRDDSITASTRMLLLFTSGTTGASKAAICSQGRLVGLGKQNSAKYGVGADDVCYCPMPLFHGNALMALWAPAVTVGACVALTPKFSASGFLGDVRAFGATFFTYVGKAIGYILSQPERDDDADNPLTHGFGTEASPEDQAAFLRRFGCQLYEGYGSSESAGMLAMVDHAPVGSLGVAAKDSVRIVNPDTLEPAAAAVLDEHGRVSNAGQAVGEIVDVEGAAKFEGYYNNDAANAEKLRNGWYWTGDRGYVDTAGYFYFAGRSGDWIRVDSENISALLIERVLRRHPDVVAAAVFAVPDARSGDQVMAAVEVGADARFDELGLSEFLSGQPDLGAKGVPRYLRVSPALPTTGSGKLRKKEMTVAGWRTDDPVYHRVGRDPVAYAPLTDADRDALHEEFITNGRKRFLP